MPHVDPSEGGRFVITNKGLLFRFASGEISSPPSRGPVLLGSSPLSAPPKEPSQPFLHQGSFGPARSTPRPRLHPASRSGKQLCTLTSRGIHWLSSGVPSPTDGQNRLFTLCGWERKICLFPCNCQAKDVLSSDRNSSRVRAGQGPSISLARPGPG